MPDEPKEKVPAMQACCEPCKVFNTYSEEVPVEDMICWNCGEPYTSVKPILIDKE